MNSNLLFGFTMNKENNTIRVKREFAAELPMVWDAFTKSELLDQWWAPKPWTSETKHMDFREGGYWLYAMVSPNNEKHWARADYLSIKTQASIKLRDGFCDENGVMNKEMPSNNWENKFISQDNTTLVDMVLYFDSLSDLEKLIAMGFNEGFTMGLSNLDELLEKLKKIKAHNYKV